MCQDHGPRGLDRRTFLRTTGAAAAVVTASAATPFPAAAAGRSETRTITGTFAAGTAPDWHYVPVDVPDGVREIAVSYEYDRSSTSLPAGLLGNVLDIGIFDPSGHEPGDAAGFRGWSGGARSSFRLSRGAATPGYLPGPIAEGRWHVILGPYSVAPEGMTWTVTITLHFGGPGPRFEAAPASRSVPGTGRAWYRGDMHLHTVHSDGRRTLPELVAAAQAAGLDFLGSTEHNTSSAGLEWGRHVPEGFLVVNGEEVTTRGGHWLALGTPAGAWVDWRYRVQDGRFPSLAGRVRDLGGVVVAAHPFSPFSGTTWTFGYGDVDAVEVWNGPWTLDDQFAVEHWHGQIVAGSYLPAVGNSDSHHSGQTVGLPQTVVLADSLSTGAIVAAIKQGRCWIAESSTVDLTFEVTGPVGTETCGGTLTAAPTDLVKVRLSVSGVPGCLATIRGAALPLATAQADADGRVHVEVEVPAGSTPFVRAEVRRPEPTLLTDPTTGTPGGPMVALTNPVFLNV